MNIEGMQLTNLPGVWTVWGKRAEDGRGLMREIWCGKNPWKLDLLTTSHQHVLRGFHADMKRWRMLTCVSGSIRHVAGNAKTGQWVRHHLTPEGPSILWRPGILSGYLVLSQEASVLYNVTDVYRPGEQVTRRWNLFGLEPWEPMRTPILSERDRNAD